MHFRKASWADGFLQNSTIPSPVDFPLSSAITIARSISPKTLNALSSNSFVIQGVRFLTLTVEECGAKRTLSARPLLFVNTFFPSNSCFAFSAFTL